MIKAGIVGLGFMGRMHFNVLRNMENVTVTSLCDIDAAKRSGDWLNVRGNVDDPRAGQVDLAGTATFEDYRELIEKADTSLIVVTTPTFLHSEIAVAALNAAKDVIVEKPMALSVEQADQMLDAAEKSGKLLFVAQCIRFWPDYMVARDIIRSKAYGKVKSAMFRRLGGAPKWCWEGWYLDARRSGGTILDLHVHDVDYIQNVFGVPPQVSSIGTIDVSCNHGAVDHVITHYHYPDGPAVTAQASWYIGNVAFAMEFVIALEKATLSFGGGNRLTIHLPDGQAQQPELPPGDGYSTEIEYFIEAISKRLPPDRMPPVEARNNIAIAMAEREAVITGRPTAVSART